jgi:hypothetical protein
MAMIPNGDAVRRRLPRSRLAGLAALLVLAAPLTGSTASAPPPLSADTSPADIASGYGSGDFGTWNVDRFGLPAYRYTMDQEHDPRAQNVELGGSVDAWHQIGNDHIVANAFNHGYVQLWSQDRLGQWTNLAAPSEKHYAGGYGYLRMPGRVLSTLYDDRPADATAERDFGVGYVRKRTTVPQADVEEFVYAPFGDDPVLVHEVTIRNATASPMSASWFEYWDVNPATIAEGTHRRGVLSPSYEPATQTLTAGQLPGATDLAPLTIFASAIGAPVSGFDTDVKAFFGKGTRAKPAAVAAGTASGSIAPLGTGLLPNRSMFALRSPVALEPGASVTLRYAYGVAHRAQIGRILARARAGTLAGSEQAWSSWLPRASFPGAGAWLARELQWDAYMVRSGATYEEACGHHILSQGGYYQYDFGFQGAFRDPLQHMMPMIYSDPALAREVLRYSAHEQPSHTGIVPYAMIPGCLRFDLGTSDDLDFWFLWAAAEYAMATRDFAFFDTVEPYYDIGSATMWDHLKLAFFHQEHLIGRGPHGGYVTGATGDWSDFETETEQMTESMLVTAQLAYAYPVFAGVADARGDRAFAAELRSAAARNLATLRKEWTGGGWYSRGYRGVIRIGSGAINSEPQSWALLAGAATPAQQTTLLHNVKRFLTGIGAPGGPAEIGSAQSPGRNDPGVNERELVPQESAVWVGGVWYALNGPLVWAAAPIDQAFAWDEFLRNTLAAHATAFPDHWDGVITVDDECHAYYSANRAQCGIGLTTRYFTQILHQPAWGLLDAIKLAGIDPTPGGYRIDPHVPSDSFSLRLPVVGIARDPGVLRGYLRPERSGPVAMEVVLPAGVTSVTAWSGAAAVPVTVSGGVARFVIQGSAGSPADWAVAW